MRTERRKRLVKGILLKMPFFVRASAWLTRNTPRIFMYHRFCTGNGDVPYGVDDETFRWQLRQLSRGWHVLTLSEYVARRQNGNSLPSYVAIMTIDDGYRDFYDIAFPLLKEYGMRATFFPTTSFVEGAWMWWDKLRFILREARDDRLVVRFKNGVLRFGFRTEKERPGVFELLVSMLEQVTADERDHVIASLERDLGIHPPGRPPDECAPVSWQQLAEMAGHGIEIGSHTNGHPVLSRINGDTLKSELSDSKRMIEARIGRPVDTLCYPHGKAADINDVVCRAARDAGYAGAVLSYLDNGTFDPYRISRMGVGRDKVDFLWKLGGMERLVLSMRNRRRSWLRTCRVRHASK